MDSNQEIQSLQAELEFVQNEIERRRSRSARGEENFRNLEKIDALRTQKNELRQRLEKLQNA
ncbi:MAG: hypothetical protein AAF495_29425 [Pseudomonadota bacterium]